MEILYIEKDSWYSGIEIDLCAPLYCNTFTIRFITMYMAFRSTKKIIFGHVYHHTILQATLQQ